jgi:hypothetical protein
MKFDDTYQFEMQSPDGNAKIVCTELPLNILHEIRAHLRLKKDGDNIPEDIVARYQTAMCESVVSVSGLEDGQGVVTAERVRAKQITPRLLDVITAASWAAKRATEEVDQKKETSKTE